MTKETKNKLICMKLRLEKACDVSNINTLNNGCSYDENNTAITLTEDLCALRKLGFKIDLPITFLDADCYGYIMIQAYAELIRQIDDYLHPWKAWFSSHLYDTVIAALSLSAIIVSIVSLIVK